MGTRLEHPHPMVKARAVLRGHPSPVEATAEVVAEEEATMVETEVPTATRTRTKMGGEDCDTSQRYFSVRTPLA